MLKTNSLHQNHRSSAMTPTRIGVILILTLISPVMGRIPSLSDESLVLLADVRKRRVVRVHLMGAVVLVVILAAGTVHTGPDLSADTGDLGQAFDQILRHAGVRCGRKLTLPTLNSLAASSPAWRTFPTISCPGQTQSVARGPHPPETGNAAESAPVLMLCALR